MKPVLVALSVLLIGATPAVRFTDYADDFDRIEVSTRGRPDAERVATFRASFQRLKPGLYTDSDPAALDKRIAKALADFPSIRVRYRAVEARFPQALDQAVSRFRQIFPDFEPPIPIVLMHSLGLRDGGSDYVAGQKTMLFGADVIAAIHYDDSLQPFLDHELFHLEHARHFADCDQLWCRLWQEGLATYAAGLMTPGASDHQLLLDQPAFIRAPTDARWGFALCQIARAFDTTDGKTIGQAFLGNQHPPELPARFGYYVGMRVAAEAAREHRLPALAKLNDAAARPVVATALSRLIADAKAPCAAPAASAPITYLSPRSA